MFSAIYFLVKIQLFVSFFRSFFNFALSFCFFMAVDFLFFSFLKNIVDFIYPHTDAPYKTPTSNAMSMIPGNKKYPPEFLVQSTSRVGNLKMESGVRFLASSGYILRWTIFSCSSF